MPYVSRPLPPHARSWLRFSEPMSDGIAGHESTRPTQLYSRLREEISIGEIERIHI